MTPLEAMVFGAEISDRVGATRRKRNEDALNKLVGGQVASGDYQGGAAALMQAGQLEPGMALQSMGEERQRAAGLASLQIARQLKSVPQADRAMLAPMMTQRLQQFGISPEQVDLTDLSDTRLDQEIMALSQLEAPGEAYTLGPGEGRFQGGQQIANMPFKADAQGSGRGAMEPFRHPELGYGQFDNEGFWHPIEVEASTDTGAMGDPSARLYTAGKAITMANEAIDTANPLNTGFMAWLRGGGDESGGIGGQSKLESQLQMLKANNAFLGLAELASQGVRLTPISNADLVVAGNMVANLSALQGTETLKGNLRQVRERYGNIYQQVLRGVQEQYPDGNIPPNVAAVVNMFQESIASLPAEGEGSPTANSGGATELPAFRSDAELDAAIDAMPSGTEFIGPDGKRYRKP